MHLGAAPPKNDTSMFEVAGVCSELWCTRLQRPRTPRVPVAFIGATRRRCIRSGHMPGVPLDFRRLARRPWRGRSLCPDRKVSSSLSKLPGGDEPSTGLAHTPIAAAQCCFAAYEGRSKVLAAPCSAGLVDDELVGKAISKHHRSYAWIHIH